MFSPETEPQEGQNWSSLHEDDWCEVVETLESGLVVKTEIGEVYYSWDQWEVEVRERGLWKSGETSIVDEYFPASKDSD